MVLQISSNPLLKDYRVVLHKRVNSSGQPTNDSYLLLGNDSNIVNSINIEYDADTPLIEASMITRGTLEPNLILNGDMISIFAPVVDFSGEIFRRIIFRGYIFDNIREPDTGEIRLVVRNLGHWLIRDTFFFTLNAGETAKEFIFRVATAANINIHTLVNTTYRIKKGKVYENASYYDAFLDVLSISMQQEGKDYNLYISPIGLVVEELNKFSGKMWVFETSFRTPTLMNPIRTRSISDPDFANVAIGYRPLDQSGSILSSITELGVGDTVTVTDQISVDKFGSFPISINTSQFNTEEEVRDHLKKTIEKKSQEVEKVSFTTFALNSLKPLDRVMLIDRASGIVGEYFIKHLTTKIRDDNFKQDLTVTKRRDIPQNIVDQVISSNTSLLSSLGV